MSIAVSASSRSSHNSLFLVEGFNRISVLGFTLVSTVFLTTPFLACAAFEAIFVTFFVTGLVSTLFLSYLRVCAVWHWNRFVVALFGVSWISVVASGFALIHSIKGIEVQGYCEDIIVGERIMAPVITSFFNHTIVFLAITFGVCKNTIGRDLTFGDCIRLMLGKSLPTFSKALLHDSQVCYIITMGIAVTTIVWFYVWLGIQPTSNFRVALASPYVVLVNIMICRVFRNTKLGLYSKVSLPTNDPKVQRSYSRHDLINGMPIQISVSQVIEHKSDYPLSKCPVDFLDFGMV